MVALWQFEIGKLWDNFSKFTPVQCAFVLAVIIVIAGFILTYKKLVPGTVQQASSDKERDDTVRVLQSENARLIGEKNEAEKREREERHRANNLEQELNGFRWAWNNALALRERAVDVEREQKEEQHG